MAIIGIKTAAVDHHETLLSIKGVCSPKYIKTQMNVKYTLARFWNCSKVTRGRKLSKVYFDVVTKFLGNDFPTEASNAAPKGTFRSSLRAERAMANVAQALCTA